MRLGDPFVDRLEGGPSIDEIGGRKTFCALLSDVELPDFSLAWSEDSCRRRSSLMGGKVIAAPRGVGTEDEVVALVLVAFVRISEILLGSPEPESGLSEGILSGGRS